MQSSFAGVKAPVTVYATKLYRCNSTNRFKTTITGVHQAKSADMPPTNKVTDPEDAETTRKSVCPRISLVPVRYTKVVHFVRHGQGFHNVAGHINHDNYKLWDYADAHLTELGWQQAEQLGACPPSQHSRGPRLPAPSKTKRCACITHHLPPPAPSSPFHLDYAPTCPALPRPGRHVVATRLPVDLVVVAPLQRALETAVAAFGGLHQRADHGNGNGGGDADGVDGTDGAAAAPLLMAAQEGLEGKRVERRAVSSRGCPPFIAQELCREHIGVHPCDRRSEVSAYKERFPAVDFSLVQPDEDALWSAEHRESKDEIRRRGLAFLKWLAARPERHIAVVSHSSFLHFTLSCFGQGAAEAVQGEMHKWYDNCEMRSLVLSDDSEEAAAAMAAGGTADEWHFAGGLHATGRPH
ncbi:hypothetical protein PLESTB_001472000 [Pleodorina starrii]|uniref:Phosphoglycerate mutase-like protein n=1 Tax=Pleodorina starrii TaxID=330485 RepID=A0A9W6BXE0_9CHLO|nr:hypothetical protein PLESTB_001472000 [Pleodorina starrii]